MPKRVLVGFFNWNSGKVSTGALFLNKNGHLELPRHIALDQVPATAMPQSLLDVGPALADPHTKLPMHHDAKS